MSDGSHIEWTDATWNPTTGCTRVSPGCDHCYIERTPPFRLEGRRFDKPGVGGATGVRLHPERLEQPLKWRKPRRVFVNSLSDLFHDDIPDEFIAQVWDVMVRTPQHVYQILTKRPRRMSRVLGPSGIGFYAADGPVPCPQPNIWLGVSVEDQKRAELRIPLLLETPAAVRFLSCEPLLGPVDLWGDSEVAGPAIQRTGVSYPTDYGTGIEYDYDDQVGIDWVIVGGESGPAARPMHPEWARSLRDQCVDLDVPFFFKQWGEWCHPSQLPPDVDGSGSFADDLLKVGKKRAGRELDGRTWNEYPERQGVLL